MYKVIVAGSRTIENYEIVKSALDVLIKDNGDIMIVSGGARGVDKLGEQYAKENNLSCMVFNANWDKHGKKAGALRNIEMAEYADALIAFWDGKSKGTELMIIIAKRRGLAVTVIMVEGEDSFWTGEHK